MCGRNLSLSPDLGQIARSFGRPCKVYQSNAQNVTQLLSLQQQGRQRRRRNISIAVFLPDGRMQLLDS